jgi:hypothetical protein
MTAQQVAFCFHAPGNTQQVVVGSTEFGSSSYVDLLEIRPADVGSPGDQLVWIVHARIGDADLSGITSPDPRGRFAMRLRDHTPQVRRVCNMTVRGTSPLGPVRNAQQQGCVTYAAILPGAATAAAGSSACLRVQLAFGWFSGQQISRNISIRVEDLTVVCWNLTRMTAQGIRYALSDTIVVQRLTTVPAAISGAIGLLPPVSGIAPWLVYGSIVTDNGSPVRSTFWDIRLASSTLAGPVGTRTRSTSPEVDGLDYIYQAQIGIVEVPSGGGSATVQVRAWDDYTAVGLEKQSRSIERQLFAVDLSSLDPVWSATNDPSIDDSPAMFGASAGKPNHGEQVQPRVTSQQALGQHRIAHAWATPWNEHSPQQRTTFASEILLNGSPNLPSSRQSPLWAISMDGRDRQPDYQSAPIPTGRGIVFLDHIGYYSAEDDPTDPVTGLPTRITRPFGSFARRAFFGLSQCLVSFRSWVGVLEDPEVVDAIGPSVYVVPGKESLAPGDLPRLPWPPLSTRSGGAVNRAARLQGLDGRVMVWGTGIAPREVWTASWQHRVTGGTQPSRADLVAWLDGLPSGVLAMEHPVVGDLRAWAVLGGTYRERTIAEGILELEVQLVELTWVGAP